MGLGDHIICNGLVREITKNKDNHYFLFTKSHNKISVDFMYRDINNLETIEIKTDQEVCDFLYGNKVEDKDVHVGGIMYHSYWFFGSKSFEESFYLQNEMSLNFKWDSFHVVRDYDRESVLKEKLGVSDNSEYIFIHDDERHRIDESRINSNYKIIRADRELTDNIFDYLSVLENAKEVHVIESSFCFILDLSKINNQVFIHRYARPLSEYEIPEYKNIHKIIN